MYWNTPFSLVFYMCFVTTVRTIVCTLTVVKSYYFEVFHSHLPYPVFVSVCATKCD